MPLRLGPIPASVRSAVQRLIAERRPDPPDPDERLNGVPLTGGPCGASYLDAAGEIWNWSCAMNEHPESVERVPDGPMKVGLVAIGAERFPELAEWLPRRPATAVDCSTCQGSGSLPPPWHQVQCPHCFGMGWSSAKPLTSAQPHR
jgi:hypothetical protein